MFPQPIKPEDETHEFKLS